MGQTSVSAIKTEEEIQIMRDAGKILANILRAVRKEVRPNTNVWALEELFLELCERNHVEPACKGYTSYGLSPYPTGLCVSINSQAVHCPSSKDTVIQVEDLVTVDTVIRYKDMHVDSAFCVAMPEASKKRKVMAKVAETTFFDAVNRVRDGVRIGVISDKIETMARRYGFNVLRDYAGHGIGHEMHEWPEIPCFGRKNEGPKLKEGMTICIEVLLCARKPNVKQLGEWETRMADNKDFCQSEHTILVKKKGFEILTL